METSTLRKFFGWCSVINTTLLLVSGICFIFMNEWIFSVYKNLLHLSPEQFNSNWFISLAIYKILIIIFNIIPYFTIRLLEKKDKS